MKFRNHELSFIINFLYSLKLLDKKSRMRVRLIKLLLDKQEQFESEQKLLIDQYSEKDELGNPKQQTTTDGKQGIKITDIQSYTAAINELMNEEIIIEATLERKDMFESITESVENCGLELSNEEAIKHDRLCDILEQIKY